jgi:hypothetical protein
MNMNMHTIDLGSKRITYYCTLMDQRCIPSITNCTPFSVSNKSISDQKIQLISRYLLMILVFPFLRRFFLRRRWLVLLLLLVGVFIVVHPYLQYLPINTSLGTELIYSCIIRLLEPPTETLSKFEHFLLLVGSEFCPKPLLSGTCGGGLRLLRGPTSHLLTR